MPAGFVRQSFRRTIVRTAVGLVVFQAFTLGLASARLAAPALAAPAGVICHGSAASATDATPDEAPDSGTSQAWHLCCVSCLFGGTAFPVPDASRLCLPDRKLPGALLAAFVIVPTLGARRAGPSSRGPPVQA